jgi:hypothetical protein
MEISYVLTEADLAAFVRYHGSRTPGGRWRRWITLLVMCGIFFVGYLVLVFSMSVDPSPTSKSAPTKSRSHIPEIVGGVLFLGILALFVARIFWPRVRLSQADRERLLGPQRIAITPEAVLVESRFASGRTVWRGVHQVGATATHVFIFMSTKTAFVVPRRAFVDEDSFEEFIETARHYWRNARETDTEEDSPDWRGEVAKAWRPKHEAEGVRPPGSEPPDDLKHRE